MDELQLLGSLLTEPGPSPDTIDRSRRRLQDRMNGPAPRRVVGMRVRRRERGFGRPGGGLRSTGTVTAAVTAAVTAMVSAAAVTAAVIVIASDPTGRSTTPDASRAAVQPSGRQVLLMAATSAESQSAATGTYWHVRTVTEPVDGHVGDQGRSRGPGPGRGREFNESWTRRDGRTWLSAVPGMVSSVGKRPLLRGTELNFDDIQRLPTGPSGLTAELRRLVEQEKDEETGRRKQLEAEEIELKTLNLLQSLLSDTPAPPKVRAAAFRALAALPNIKSLGRAPYGYRLLISYATEGTQRIVVDPEAARLDVENWTGFGGGGMPVGPSRTTAEWTSTLSGELVPWKEQVPYLNPKGSGPR